MTLPDDLVKAASDAVLAEWALFRAPRSGGTELVRSEYEEVIRTAVAAVLRALHESDEAKRVVALELPVSLKAGDWNGYIADNILAAIAKLADDA